MENNGTEEIGIVTQPKDTVFIVSANTPVLCGASFFMTENVYHKEELKQENPWLLKL